LGGPDRIPSDFFNDLLTVSTRMFLDLSYWRKTLKAYFDLDVLSGSSKNEGQ
jgi:hypothetical protein